MLKLLKKIFYMALIVAGLVPLLSHMVISEEAAALDQEMRIDMPGGGALPLRQVLARAAAGERISQRLGRAAPAAWEVIEGGSVLEAMLTGPAAPGPGETDLYRLGRHAARSGKIDQAVALLRSVPAEHPEYSRAQRFLGWDLYTEQLDRPDIGIDYVTRSLRADVFEGNAWQDAYRVYLKSITPGWFR